MGDCDVVVGILDSYVGKFLYRLVDGTPMSVADLYMADRRSDLFNKSLMTSRSRVQRVTDFFNVVQTFQSARVGLGLKHNNTLTVL